MWVQLKSTYKIEHRGKMVSRGAGDWIKIGKQEAQRLIAQNRACLPGQDVIKAFTGGGDTGILVLGSPEAATLALEDIGEKLNIKYSDTPGIPWEKTIIWNPMARLRVELIPAGLGLLDTWQIAVPLWDNYSLATQEGTPEERELTKAIIRDLRVPMYDTRLLYVKQCNETTALFSQWQEERKRGDSDKLAFLRAFYPVKPFMLALPITWTGQFIGNDR